MDCRHFDELVSPYIDGVLDLEDLKEFERHLSQCVDCGAKLEQTRLLISLMGSMDDESLPQGFSDRLIKGMKVKVNPRRFTWIKWASAVAGIMIMLISMKFINDVNRMDKRAGSSLPAGEMAGDMGLKSESRAYPEAPDDISHGLGVDDNGDSYKEGEKMEDDSQSEDEQGSAYAALTRGMQSDTIELYVQDVCITPQTLKYMAINNGLTLIDSDGDSVVIETISDDHRDVLYRELSKIGEIKEVGQEIEGGKVRIIIKEKD